MRLIAMQIWPVVSKTPWNIRVKESSSNTASSRRIAGSFPPSTNATLVKVGNAIPMIRRPHTGWQLLGHALNDPGHRQASGGRWFAVRAVFERAAG
ncbi:MAG: hypothetical protein ABI255_09315 [Microbacteriaceae bacterium]